MTNAVEKLGQAPCPECKGSGLHSNYTMPDIAGNRVPCSTCGGTGALVPGLRRGCKAPAVWTPINFGGIARSQDNNPRSPNNPDYCHRDNCWGNCQGRGWVLIPAAGVMGVLVRAAKTGIIRLYEGNGWGYKPCDTPEEALAAAILQALGVE